MIKTDLYYKDAERDLTGLQTWTYAEGDENFDNFLGITLTKKGKEAKQQAKSGNCSSFTKDTPLRGKGTLCAGGTPVYIGTGFATLSQWEKSMNRCICQKRKEAKVKDDVAPSGSTVDDSTSIPTSTNMPPKQTQDVKSSSVAPKSKTGLYVGLGIGGLLILGVAGYFIFRKK